MTRRALERRVERWRRLLAPEWRITLVAEELDEGDAGQYRGAIRAGETNDHADLWLDPELYRRAELGEVDVTIVHELLHLHFESYRRPVDAVKDSLRPAVAQIVARELLNAEERIVERLARIIARLEHPDGIVYGVTSDP